MENPYSHSNLYETAQPQPAQIIKHSKLGISSFILSIITALGILGTFGVAAYLEVSNPGGVTENESNAMIIGLGIIFFTFCGVVALVLGAIGLFQHDTKKVFSILGVVFALSTGLFFAGLMIVGSIS